MSFLKRLFHKHKWHYLFKSDYPRKGATLYHCLDCPDLTLIAKEVLPNGEVWMLYTDRRVKET